MPLQNFMANTATSRGMQCSAVHRWEHMSRCQCIPLLCRTTNPQEPITAHVGVPGSHAQMQINFCLNHPDKAGWHSLDLQGAHQPEVKPIHSTLQGNLNRQLSSRLLIFYLGFLLTTIWMSSNHPLSCFPISGCHPLQHQFRSGTRA